MSSYTFKTFKDSAETIDYSIDYTKALNGTDPFDVLSESVWRIEGRDTVGGLAIETDIFTGTVATVMVSGGERTERYRLINTVTTVGGRIFERSILVEIKNK